MTSGANVVRRGNGVEKSRSRGGGGAARCGKAAAAAALAVAPRADSIAVQCSAVPSRPHYELHVNTRISRQQARVQVVVTRRAGGAAADACVRALRLCCADKNGAQNES
eukprot:1593536-Pleurochrysis_carterae.AAC.3